MARWWLVRHAQSTANAEGWLAGHRDAPLTSLGRDQAAAVAQRLAGAGFERAVSSDLSRARSTAEAVLVERGVRLEMTAALRERDAGEWTGAMRRALEGTGPDLSTWAGRPPGGESLGQVAERALTWFADQPDVDTLVVAHGALLRAVLGALDDLPGDEAGQLLLGNCEVVEREVAPEAWRVALQRVARSVDASTDG
jgi:broad specificity phosphatase PhoE